ncbi:MAG TPA: carboxymuconolactone decarboxylase family protein [Amycolatopsis sp.]|uniref:carboxymuconolactone decarboxylase family protein n=1 Tax=Amycolatopsis sp. TaxID=37632 RepID=UPI002B48DDA0|nr:carboxymuconolactone decarboxylase family protein [Amycolatopsis sp.]HKS49165.1 carboxymuconolactone decarboxylase family protein [Amycolatopsis sp.]
MPVQTVESRVNLKSLTAEVSVAMRGLHTAAVEAAGRAGVDPALAELIRIRVSQINGCVFCLDMHTRDARNAGETEGRIYALSAWQESPAFTPAEKAALALAEAITLVHDGHVPDEVYRAAAAEFGEGQIAALIWISTVINAYNRTAISTRMVPAQ